MTLPTRSSFLAILGSLSLADCSPQQVKASQFPPADAVLKSLSDLKQSVRQDNFIQMGFDSLTQAQASVNGLPLLVYFVRLDALKNYNPDQDNPDTLILAADQIIYPVEADQQTRSLFRMSQINGEWRSSQFGGAASIRNIEAARREIEIPRRASAFIIEVLSLSITYVAVRVDGKIPEGDHPGGTLNMYQVGKKSVDLPPGRSALQVFKLLAPLAKTTADQPG